MRPGGGPCVFPLSRPSPARPYQPAALRRQAAHRWEEEEKEKKKYCRLNINIIEGFWETFLSHVDGIALLNGGQPLFLLLSFTLSLFLHSLLLFPLLPSSPLLSLPSPSSSLSPPPSHLGTSLNLSGIPTVRSHCCRCPPGIMGKGLLRFDLLTGDVLVLRPLPCLVCLNTHTHTYARTHTHTHVPASGVCNRQREFFTKFSNSSISLFSPLLPPIVALPLTSEELKKGLKMSDGSSLRAEQPLLGNPERR